MIIVCLFDCIYFVFCIIEGGGFVVYCLFLIWLLMDFDLFLLFDEMGLVDYVFGEVVGVFDYLYCGFEIVIYVLDGCFCYCDLFGYVGMFGFGDV